MPGSSASSGVSLLFGGIELALPCLDGVLPVPRGIFAAPVFTTNVAAGVSRFVAQRHIHDGGVGNGTA